MPLTAAGSGAWWRWTFRDPLTGKVLREFTSEGVEGTNNWKWQKDYVWRDGVLLATVQRNPNSSGTTTYHYHLDHLGTPRRVTDDADRIVGVHDYHAFGPEVSGGTDEQSLSLMKYTGHERDVVDGQAEALDYMMARYYSGRLGRFLSVDPFLNMQKALNAPQRWNRYSYVSNNPMRKLDPDGRDEFEALGRAPRDLHIAAAYSDTSGSALNRMLRIQWARFQDRPLEVMAEVLSLGLMAGESAAARPMATMIETDATMVTVTQSARLNAEAFGAGIGSRVAGQLRERCRLSPPK
jgi:RHS repeat-associated protein